MQIQTLQPYLSIPAGLNFELPPFTVLTGTNGSGKTHLFQTLTMANAARVTVGQDIIPHNAIRYIPFGGLAPNQEGGYNPQDLTNRRNSLWSALQKAIQQVKNQMPNARTDDKTFESNVIARIPAQANNNQQALLQGVARAKQILVQNLTESDIGELVKSQLESTGEVFTSHFSQVFKLYHVRYHDNLVNKVYLEDDPDCGRVHLTKDEFRAKYGEPPWEFLNDILVRLRLPFKSNTPMKMDHDATFQFKLTHIESGVEISTNELSTGEKVLMSLALALYNTSKGGVANKLLVIDEPDAPLHPTMSKLLLEMIQHEIVIKRKIPVIISTHSPTTIACAPAESLFKLNKETKIPERCNLEDSIALLTAGIPNFTLSLEKRRQVFVEHSYDVGYFESLFRILSRTTNFDTHPQFLPPHTLNGSNCSAVIEITDKLRKMGNSQVYGLIDWDKTNNSNSHIIVLGQEKRYAIENYIFEPHFVGLYLVYKGFATPEEIGLPECMTYIDVITLIKSDPSALQRITDTIETQLWDNHDNKVTSLLVCGESLVINELTCHTQGHKYEELLKEKWHKLRGITSNNNPEAALKNDVLGTVINHFPEYISQDIADTFKAFS